MNRRILKRFVVICAIATFAMFSVWTVVWLFSNEEPGDYYTRQGDIRLGEDKLDEAMASFDKALAEMPDHRGALMGRALVHIEAGREPEALAELTYLIGFLEKTLEEDDRTGWAALAAAYTNRGILHDRAGRYRKALEDYVKGIRVDEGAVSGPSLFDKIIYGTPRPSTARDRAVYLDRQLKLPPGQRLFRVPEIDDKQRMYKP